MSLNPPSQYVDESNLRARQRLFDQQQPKFDIVGWVLGIAGLTAAAGQRVLDAGCGNGRYLDALGRREIAAVGCDLSLGMLAATAAHSELVNADVTALPFATSVFDVVLAPHMLYHVAERELAADEMRRVLRDGGLCVVVTNGRNHMHSLTDLIEAAVRVTTPGWEMKNPSTHVFSLDNGEKLLGRAFRQVECVRPVNVAPVTLTDAAIVADYVSSVADHYEHQAARPWPDIVDDVRSAVQREIDTSGAFTVHGDVGAFVCR